MLSAATDTIARETRGTVAARRQDDRVYLEAVRGFRGPWYLRPIARTHRMLRGEVLPVLGARELLALPPRPLGLSDRFIIVRLAARRAAIVVDRVEGVDDIGVVADPGPDRNDGLTVGRRAGATDGEALVALINLDRLLANSAVHPTERTRS